MNASPDDLTRLASLIEAAQAQAAKLGGSVASIAATLDEALRDARSLASRGARPVEGVPVEDLTTENDK